MSEEISEEGSVEISASDLGLSTNEPVESEESVEEEVVETVEAASEEVGEVVPEAEEATVEIREMPKSWKKEWEETWKTLPPEAQEIYETREKQMTEGLEQYRQHSDLGKQIDSVVQPYNEFLQQQGVAAPQALQYLLNAHYSLTNGTPEQKQQWFDYLKQSYGLAENSQEEVDPAIKSLQDQVGGLQQILTQSQREQQAQSYAEATKEVETFASDKPYFDDVADDIVAHINAGASLQDAYEKAVWANPVTREKEMARVSEEREKERLEKAKAEADTAKKAKSANVRSRDTSKTPTEPLGTMEDTMKATLKNIKERVH